MFDYYEKISIEKLTIGDNSLSVSPNKLKNKLSKFVLHLLSMNDKIVLHEIMEEHKFFCFEKDDASTLLITNDFFTKEKLDSKYISKFGVGYYPHKDNICFAYLKPSISHEIAHLVEMKNPKRWTIPDFGMMFGEAKTNNNLFSQVSRECRVRAIQTFLQPKNKSLHNILSEEYYGKVKDIKIGKLQSSKDMQEYFDDIRDKTINAWNEDRIEHEWKIRMEHIRNWQDTV